MDTKEQLVNTIKEFISAEDRIKERNQLNKEDKLKKKDMTNNLIRLMKENNLDSIDINGGSLLYKKNKIKKGLTSKILLSSLQTFFKDDTKTVEELSNFILNNREECIKETIKRKIF